MKIHKSIKKIFEYNIEIKDSEMLSDWKERTSKICKPCWELKYCPYGPLVEDFPLLPPIRKDMEEHNKYLIECLKTGKLGSGGNLDEKRKKIFEENVKNFEERDYPESIPKVFAEASCKVFGHVCPVFLVSEPLTETKDRRKHSRLISREVMLKVIRRDGQICQKCNNPVFDNEVEFDHIIPFSKGGNSTAENLRLVHRNCNRSKGNSLGEILHPNPIEHLFELRKKKIKKSK